MPLWIPSVSQARLSDCVLLTIMIAGILSRSPEHTVIYVLLQQPRTLLLERILSLPSISKTAIIHFIDPSSLHPRNIPTLAFEVYDRLPILLRPIPKLLDPASPVYLPHPHFTLAPDDPPKIEFTLQWPIRNYEVMNKWRWVHCGYVIDWDNRVGVGFMVDEAGEGWEVQVCKGIESVKTVWEWMVSIADGWAVQWRGSITCLGEMRKEEIASMFILHQKGQS
jgi:hypothetical protein